MALCLAVTGTATWLFLALCHSGTLAFWHYGTMALWQYGTLPLWYSGTLALWQFVYIDVYGNTASKDQVKLSE